jgi:hypothetical protein
MQVYYRAAYMQDYAGLLQQDCMQHCTVLLQLSLYAALGLMKLPVCSNIQVYCNCLHAAP